MARGYGYFLDSDVERIHHDVRLSESDEGTREVQTNTIARALSVE